MNLPFTIGDLLERVIPGGVLLAYLGFSLFGADLIEFAAAVPLAGIVFLMGLAYSFGVILNALASWSNLGDNRIYWALASSKHSEAVRNAVRTYFELEPTEDSWKYCYGICAKHG